MKRNDFDLLYELVRTNFKLKYNDSVLGFLWVLLKPFVMFLVLYVIFSQVGKAAVQKNFPVYLLLGIILYNYFNESVTFGMNSLLDKAHIILKVNFNRSIAVISSQSLAVVNLIINLIILLIFAVFSKVNTSIEALLYYGLILAILTTFTLGLSFFTSVAFVKFRDLLHITEISMQLLFYSSAIFFPITQVPERMSFLFLKDIPVRSIFELNPLYILIQTSRDAVINGEITHQTEIMVIGIISLVFAILGSAFFNSRVRRVSEYF